MEIKPTCRQLFDEELGEAILREDDASWRHGSYRTEVFFRAADNTYWEATYEVSTDGECHGLRQGTADITQVFPYKVMVTRYASDKETADKLNGSQQGI